MPKKISEERDIAGKYRVWYEISDEGAEFPEAQMFKFQQKPTDAEVEATATAFIAAKKDREQKERDLEALRIQVADLEAQLNL